MSKKTKCPKTGFVLKSDFCRFWFSDKNQSRAIFCMNFLYFYKMVQASVKMSQNHMFVTGTAPGCLKTRFHIFSVQLIIYFAGTVSIYTMVVIGYDRYNVIVKGFSGTKISMGKAFGILVSCQLGQIIRFKMKFQKYLLFILCGVNSNKTKQNFGS